MHLLLFAVLITLLAPSIASAGCDNCLPNPDSLGIPELGFQAGATTIIKILGIIAGILSVVFIILGGIKYITSNGNPKQIDSAKQTIMYAIIGLAVSVIAPLIVAFALTQTQ